MPEQNDSNPREDQENPPEPTIPGDLSAKVSGLPEDMANKVGSFVLTVIRDCSRYLPLSNLDGVTIAFDYESALKELDRGFPTYFSPEPTEDDSGFGVAMSLIVRRKEKIKTHIIFGPAIAAWTEDLESEKNVETAVQVIVHELGHAVDHEYKFRALGDFAFRSQVDIIPDALERYLWSISSNVWDEYFANRISTSITNSDGSRENDLFVSIQRKFRERISESRRKYHFHLISLEDFLEVVRQNLHTLLMATGYLFGFNDARAEDVAAVREANAVLERPNSKELRLFHEPLLTLWARQGKWDDYDEFLALNKPTKELLKSLDLYPSLTATGEVYMDVPIL